HHELDIRNRPAVLELLKEVKPSATVHAAAQPSHDLAASRPWDDFDVNAVGTLNLLEAARRVCPESPFVHMSTNKVYGDAPSFLVKCNLDGKLYKVFGYKGKQVRDNIHAYDVAQLMVQFIQQPRCGEVYNLGGGRGNSISMLEAFELAESVTGKPMKFEYCE